jgi:hypothetical protein
MREMIWNPNNLVNWEPMQNFTTLGQSLLGEEQRAQSERETENSGGYEKNSYAYLSHVDSYLSFF